MKKKAGERTLLASVLLSAPGPIVVGLGLLMGRSSTQFADFVRRTAELVAIIVSWAIYGVTNKTGADEAHKAKLEHIANVCVGAAMCLGGVAMIIVAFLSSGSEQGNVVPGLVIAVLGVVTNTWFWLRYCRLNNESPNAILAVQANLYRAKALVDACVVVALAAVAVAPGSAIAYYMDIAGTVVVAAYLVVNGCITIWGKNRKREKTALPESGERP